MLVSCQSKEDQQHVERKISDEKAFAQYQHDRKVAMAEINAKYNIAVIWDSVRMQYSVDYLPYLNGCFQIVEDYRISDVYLKDSIRFLSILAGELTDPFSIDFEGLITGITAPSFYFTFPISVEQERILRSNEVKNVLVVKIKDIKKVELSIKGEQEDEYTTKVYLEGSKLFKGYGEIIEIKSIKRIPTLSDETIMRFESNTYQD